MALAYSVQDKLHGKRREEVVPVLLILLAEFSDAVLEVVVEEHFRLEAVVLEKLKTYGQQRSASPVRLRAGGS